MNRFLIVSLFLILLAGCSTSEQPPTGPTPTAAPTPQATPSDLTTTPEPLDLTVWLPDWMLLEDIQAAQIIQDTIDDFSAANNVNVEIIIKPESGPGGILDALSKTFPVAPALLPDLIALPLDDAELAAEEDYLQSLDSLVSQERKKDLYPFARDVGRTDEAWMAIPYAADFEHLAFQPSALSDIPLQWSVILEANADYAFPADGPEASLTDALLIHYLSTVAPNSDPLRNEAALRQLLAFYESAQAANLIDESSLTASRPADTWPRALERQVALAHTTASLWLEDLGQTTALRFGPIPTADGRPRYIPHGWAYAIVTADPARQNLSAQLIDRLMAPETLAAWSQAAHRLPASRSALALWPADNFTLFAGEALETASREPLDLLADTDFIRSIHRAILDVLSGATDAETATSAAVENW